MLAATAVGIAAIRWDWPRAPLLLALVLGDTAERYLFLSYGLYEWTWLGRPLVIAFAALTMCGVVWPFVRRWRTRRVAPAGRAFQARRRPSTADIAITVGFVAMAITVLLQARSWPFRTGLFPLFTSSVLLALGVLKLTRPVAREEPQHARNDRIADEESEDPDLTDVFATASRIEWAKAMGWMIAFFVMLWLLGALAAVPLFALMYLLAASRESFLLAGSYAFMSWLFVYGLFDRLLHVPL
jgi:hypothetical protein